MSMLCSHLPRFLSRAAPWCYCTSLVDYSCCIRLFFERSLPWSPFGAISVILDDTVPLIPHLVTCARYGIITYNSHPGRDTKTVRQREYVQFLLWKRENVDVDLFVEDIRKDGYLVYIDFDREEEILITEAHPVDGVWKPYTYNIHTQPGHTWGRYTHQRKADIIDDVFCYASPKLRATAHNELILIRVYDPVWGRSQLIQRIATIARNSLPVLPESRMYCQWSIR